MMTCVNRNCNQPMASFTEGRLFHFEILSISVSADDRCTTPEIDEIPRRAGFQFWLCGCCASTMTLSIEPVGGLQLVPMTQMLGPSAGTEEFDHFLGAIQQG